MPHLVHFSPFLLSFRRGSQWSAWNRFSAPKEMPVGQKRHQKRRILNDEAKTVTTNKYDNGKAKPVLYR
jgi:hypothetical protein